MDCSLPGSSVHGILQARLLQGIFPTQGSKLGSNLLCLLHWHVGSLLPVPITYPNQKKTQRWVYWCSLCSGGHLAISGDFFFFLSFFHVDHF